MLRAVLIATLLAASPPSAGSPAVPDLGATMLGLRLVPTRGGWARYRTESSEGPTTLVVRVGGREARQGREGTWIAVEVDVPEAGRVVVEYLLAEGVLTPDHLLAMRASVAGQKPQERPLPARKAPPDAGALAQPRGTTRERIGAKVIDVMRYSFAQGPGAGWSSAVPGFGLVRIEGPSGLVLEDFGVGGDPWRPGGARR